MDPRGFPTTLPEFQRVFPDDAACARYLEHLRWPNGFTCPKCVTLGEPYRFAKKRASVVLSLTLAHLGSPPESGVLQVKWVRREFLHCLGVAETVKKLTRPIFDASNDR